eukprot:UN05459
MDINCVDEDTIRMQQIAWITSSHRSVHEDTIHGKEIDNIIMEIESENESNPFINENDILNMVHRVTGNKKRIRSALPRDRKFIGHIMHTLLPFMCIEPFLDNVSTQTDRN